jgi:putative transposase
MPWTIEWLSDNGSCYIAGDTRSFAHDPGLEPRVTPIIKMAEAFVRTIKRDYIRIIRAPTTEPAYAPTRANSMTRQSSTLSAALREVSV